VIGGSSPLHRKEKEKDNVHEIDLLNLELRVSQSRRKSPAHVTEISPDRHNAVTVRLLRLATTNLTTGDDDC
jgi:hypothetical protein